MIHAIIDIGSSTVRLAIYLIEPDHVEMLMKKKHLLGLASYLEEGRMSETGILKTIKVLDDFKRFLHDLGINAITAFTTAALRNAANSKEAVQSISVATGIPIRVISGDEEATYDFIGATHGMKSREGLLVDIGGASTEIVSFKDKKIRNKISLPMGSLLFASQYVQELLPGREEADEMRRAADDILKSAPAFLGLEHPQVCGIGGTFKGAYALYHAIYGRHGGDDMQTGNIHEIVGRLSQDGPLLEDNAILLMRCVPDRIHTILPGMLIAEVLMRHFHSNSVIYADSGVREGYIYKEILAGK